MVVVDGVIWEWVIPMLVACLSTPKILILIIIATYLLNAYSSQALAKYLHDSIYASLKFHTVQTTNGKTESEKSLESLSKVMDLKVAKPGRPNTLSKPMF